MPADLLWKRGGVPSVVALLDGRAAEGGPPYLTVCGHDIGAAELAAASGALDGFLESLAIQPGDRVGLLFENCHEAVIALLGCLRAGAIVVPINAALRGRFLEHVLADSGARVIFAQRDLLDRLRGTLDGSVLEHVVVTGGAAADDDRLPGLTYWTFEEALAAAPRRATRTVAAEDTAVCLYTGGTTGPSKGCVLSHVALVHHSITSSRAYGRTAADVFWTPLPLFHLNAIKFGVIGGLVCGGRSVISKKFSLSGFWNEIAANDATIANLLGSMAALIARSPNERHDATLRLLIAVPLPQDADALLRSRFGIDTWSGFYGMTECSTIGLLPHGEPHRAGSAGLINSADYEVKILDEAGDEVAPGESGEIVARPRRPDIMFKGYWNKPAATLATFRDLWFRSGDIGRVDADGYLYFVDRKGDYLRRRGENVSTTEVEAVLVEHPAIVEVAVHAVPSEIAEDDIKITAVRKPGAELSEPAFFEWMRERLPYFALPTYIEFRDDLPRSPVGRVLKRELRAEGVTPATWNREAAGAVFERR